MSVLGAVEVVRQYWTCPDCGHREFMYDHQIQWRHGQSAKLRNWVARCCQAMPYDEAQALLAELLGVRLAHRTVETITGELGAHLRQAEDQAVFSGPLPEPEPGQPIPEYLCIAIDAVKVPLRGEWVDMKVAQLYVWLPGATEREGTRVAVEYVCGIEPWDRFGQRVAWYARRRGSAHGARVVVIGDGADWIWDLAQRFFPGAIEILDWYHATQHLWTVGKALYGERPEAHAWVEARKTELWQGQVQQVVARMGYAGSGLRRRQTPVSTPELHKAVRDGQRYFRKRARRMCYDRYRAQGLCVGSGTVEAACKNLVTQRAKGSGMRWTKAGLLHVLTLRARYLSKQWDQVEAGLLAA